MMKCHDLFDEMADWRHDFHRHPELGFAEDRTSARVAELLESFGLEVHKGIGKTGVVGVLQRGNGPKSIAFRADMDALPLHETGTAAYRSEHDGVMHACGHDGHTSMLLGAAKYLAKTGNFNGRAIFIFQPNEENGYGARAMIEDGLFADFPADAVFAMHNIPGMPAGHFATRSGAMTASEALFEITISARGGHAALPHMGVDAILVGAELVTSLQSIVARKLDPAQHAVVSVTEFITDGKRNVLPGHAVLKGDARALSHETNLAIETHMRQLAKGVAAAHDVQIDVSYDTVFPAIQNDAAAVAMATDAARLSAGENAVNDSCAPKLFSEDFAHMTNMVPGCFMLIGNGTDGAHARPLHATDYDFNDEILVPGASYIATLIENTLTA
jgi:hippurate hydrolase